MDVKGRAGLAFVVGIPVSDRFRRARDEMWWNDLVSRGAPMAVDFLSFVRLLPTFWLYSYSGNFSVESITTKPKTYFQLIKKKIKSVFKAV